METRQGARWPQALATGARLCRRPAAAVSHGPGAAAGRGGRSGRNYPHVEPAPKSQQHLREAVRAELNHWTHWRGVNPAVMRVNRILRGWSGYYHYRNSSQVFGKMKWWVATRLKRWLWRKHACARALWEAYPDEKLYAFYGLWPLPVQTAWTARRTT